MLIHPTGVYFCILTCVVGLLVGVYLSTTVRWSTRLLCFCSIFTLSMLCFFTAGDLIVLGVFFEMQAFALLGLLLQPQQYVSSTTLMKGTASAALYLLGYTLLSGSLYAYGAWCCYALFGTLALELLHTAELPMLAYVCFFLSGAIKLALAPFHIWLGKVHTEASTVGSILLAALSLKTGFYLHVQLCSTTAGALPVAVGGVEDVVILLCIAGSWFCALVLFVQVDIKRWVALYSLSHIQLWYAL